MRAGANPDLPPDSLDLDGDGDVIELLPIDLDGNPRRADTPATEDTGVGPAPIVEMGAYEHQPCAADCDIETGPNVLDIFDYFCFLGRFAAGDDRADFTGDGLLDIFDFLAFQNAFAAGCH